MRVLSAFVFCALFTATAHAQTSYLCVADAMTGFSFNSTTKTWSPKIMDPGGRKYMLRPPREFDREHYKDAKYLLVLFGTQKVFSECVRDFDSENDLNCGGTLKFDFNRRELRYQLIDHGGYVNLSYTRHESDTLAEGDTFPYIEIGRCSPV